MASQFIRMDEEYDVRAVEARLAHMEAKRRMRAELTHQQHSPRQPEAHRHHSAVATDFDLSAVDSSASESDSDGEELTATRTQASVGRIKSTLRDSLDLSMSMVHFEVSPRKKPLLKQHMPKKHDHTPPIVAPAPTITSTLGRERVCDSVREDAGSEITIGRLVQRRRELERQSTEPMAASNKRTSLSEQTATQPVLAVSIVATVASRLQKPVALPSDRLQPKPLATNTKTEKQQQQTNRASVLEHKVAVSIQHSQAQERKEAATPTVDHKLSAIGPAQPRINQSKPTAPAPVTDQPAQPSKHPSARINADATASTAPASTAPASTAPASIAPTIKPVHPQSVAAVPPTKMGYARAPATVTTATVVTPSISEPQDDTTDFIDDLLSAEELRLRESLDKLSSRLHSLSTARTTANAPPNNQLETPSTIGTTEDTKSSLRVASYGGGTHAKLHQPSSPSTRTSLAKRTEISSGVHKARVRPGATVAVQDPPNVAMESKHKVVIKRDLAHLLF